LFVVDATEENKDWHETDEILKFFEFSGVLRREAIIVIGGGVLDCAILNSSFFGWYKLKPLCASIFVFICNTP